MSASKMILPEGHDKFFAEISEIFKNNSEISKHYSATIARNEYSLSKIHPKSGDCLKVCTDDDGETYCCESQP